MRTKVQRRIPNWSRKREQLYTGHGGTGGAVHWGGTQQTSRAASQIPLRVQIRTSALDRRYLEIHVYASSYEVWPSKFSDPITHFNHQDCFPPTHRIEFPVFFKVCSDGNFNLHFDTFQVSDNWVVWLICCIFPSLATLPNGFLLTFYCPHNQERRKHKAAQTQHTTRRGCG